MTYKVMTSTRGYVMNSYTIANHQPLFSLQANKGVITMGPNADDTPVRPSFKPYTVPRVDCCTTTIINDTIVYYDQSIDNTGS